MEQENFNKITAGYHKKGNYSADWSIDDERSGIYYCYLLYDGHKKIKKIIVIR